MSDVPENDDDSEIVVGPTNRPTLWLQPCYGCKEKDATIAALREHIEQHTCAWMPTWCDKHARYHGDSCALLAPAPRKCSREGCDRPAVTGFLRCVLHPVL